MNASFPQSLTSHPLHHSVHTRLRVFHLRRWIPAPPPGGRFLEVGCGLGYLIQRLGAGYSGVGVDADEAGLRHLPPGGGVRGVQGRADCLPFADASFDVILCSEVLEHLPEGEDRRAVAEMARLLGPGGRLLITVPALEGLRARTALRNLGHGEPGGEYHYRMGYRWEELAALWRDLPGLRIRRRRFAMFLISELFMDLLKWVYLRKQGLKEHSDLMGVRDSRLYRLYRRIFPLLHACFVLEDLLLASWLKGHIHLVCLEREGQP